MTRVLPSTERTSNLSTSVVCVCVCAVTAPALNSVSTRASMTDLVTPRQFFMIPLLIAFLVRLGLRYGYPWPLIAECLVHRAILRKIGFLRYWTQGRHRGSDVSSSA